MDPKSYARAELRKASKRLENAKEGSRSFALEAAAESLGGLVARGWLSPGDLSKALLAACVVNGLADVDSQLAMRAVIRTGLSKGLKTPHADLEADTWDQTLANVAGEISRRGGRIIEKIGSQDLLEKDLKISPFDYTPSHGYRLAKCMSRLGWSPSLNGMRIKGKLQRGYWRVRPKDAA